MIHSNANRPKIIVPKLVHTFKSSNLLQQVPHSSMSVPGVLLIIPLENCVNCFETKRLRYTIILTGIIDSPTSIHMISIKE